jgi:hypothetical protein
VEEYLLSRSLLGWEGILQEYVHLQTLVTGLTSKLVFLYRIPKSVSVSLYPKTCDPPDEIQSQTAKFKYQYVPVSTNCLLLGGVFY